MSKKKQKKQISKKNNFGLILVILLFVLVIGATVFAFSQNKQQVENTETKINFNEMYEKVGDEKKVSQLFRSLDGKTVTMNGYMAVQSPLDESFIYFVGQPYVSCPFCAIGDITKLEVMQVIMANGEKIKYTEDGITVTGKLEVKTSVDSEGYTTRCRIYADSILPMTDENVDKELQEYYANLSKAGMIIDIQSLQMNIEYDTNADYMKDYGKNKVEIMNNIAENYQDIQNYVNYIKECPDIVKQCEPTREDLVDLNNQLIDLYNEQIIVLENFANIIIEAQMPETNNQRKEELYDSLIELNKNNMKMYEKFTVWDSKLRS